MLKTAKRMRKALSGSTENKVTIHEVAAAAGVSIATVSRALNTPQRVQPAIRARVDEAVARLGYVAHGAARALASRRSDTIGAIVPTLDNAIFAAGIHALQLRLDGHGKVLLLASTEYDPERERRELRALIERGVDGVMLVGSAHDRAIAGLIAAARVPAVAVWTNDPACAFPTIGFDNHAAMGRLVDHLWMLGHRRFAMIAGVTAGNDRAAARVDGLRAALATRGAAAPIVLERPYEIREGREAMRGLRALAMPPSAVVCGNDVLALGALFEAQALGLAVPGQVSITGFDDLELASQVSPGLTTIRVPAAEMGRRAADALVAAARDGSPLRSIVLDVELILRASTGPAPG